MKHQQSQSNVSAAMLSLEEMAGISGGADKCKGLSYACGAGIAVSLFTGGLGAIMFGPSTGALCYAAYRC